MSTITLRSAKGSPLTNTEVDNNFVNLNTDKYQSGDSPTFTNVTMTGTQTNSIAATVSATGTDQATSQALTKTVNVVTNVTSGSADGVRLPAAAAGLYVSIVNTTNVSLKVYPNGSNGINALTAASPYILAPYSSLELYGRNTSTWYTQTPLVVYDSAGTRLN